MDGLRIAAVDVVEGGVVVTYDDDSCAFYEEAVLMTHLYVGLGKKAPRAERLELRARA